MLVSTALFAASCGGDSGKQPEELITKSNITVEGGRLTPEVMHSMGKVSDPQVSPDGSKILYGVAYTSIPQNKNNRELFVMNADGSDQKQLTTTSGSENNARWINNGNEIAYLSGGQLWMMKADGTGAKKVSDYENGINEFDFSPDGSKIMFVSDVKADKKAVDLWPDLDKANGRMYSDLMYRHWDHFVETIPHTFIADFDGKGINNITDILENEPYELPVLPFGGIDQLNWSPDGLSIAYSSRKLTGKEYAFSTNTDIYIYNIAEKTHENITDGMPGYDTDPLFSPDGKTIAWISMERAGFEADKKRIFIMDIETKVKTELTTDFPYNAESITWLADGSGLYFTSCVKALTGVYLVNLAEMEKSSEIAKARENLKNELSKVSQNTTFIDGSNPNQAINEELKKDVEQKEREQLLRILPFVLLIILLIALILFFVIRRIKSIKVSGTLEYWNHELLKPEVLRVSLDNLGVRTAIVGRVAAANVRIRDFESRNVFSLKAYREKGVIRIKLIQEEALPVGFKNKEADGYINNGDIFSASNFSFRYNA